MRVLNEKRPFPDGIGKSLIKLLQLDVDNSSNVRKSRRLSKSDSDLSRDAKAMADLLDHMTGGMDAFHIIFDALLRLHGDEFRRQFREEVHHG